MVALRWAGGTSLAVLLTYGCSLDWDGLDPRHGQVASSTGGGGTVSSSSVATGGGQGGEGEGGGGALCGGVGALTDDFDDDSPNPWVGTLGDGIVESEGRLNFVIEPLRDAANYYSQATYDLTGRSLGIRIAEMTAGAGFYFSLDTPAGEYAEFLVDGDFLQAVQRIDDTPVTLTSIPFDLDAQRYLRLREGMGMLHYEYSAEGTNWTKLEAVSSANLFSLEHVSLNMGYYDQTPSGDPRRISVDALFATPGPEPHCPFDVEDDFEAAEIDRTTWHEALTSEDCRVVQEDGRLIIELGADAETGCDVLTIDGWDIRDRAVVVRFGGLSPLEESQLWLDVASLDGHDGVSFNATREGIFASRFHDGEYEQLDVEPSSFSKDMWARLRFSGDQVLWELSDDGMLWDPFHVDAVPFSPEAVQVYIGGGVYVDNDVTGSADVFFESLSWAPSGS